MKPPKTPTLITLLTTTLLLLLACSTPSDPPPTKPPSLESEVKEAYEDYWEMGARLLGAPDPADTEIPLRVTGQAQTDLVAGLEQLESAGRRFRVGPSYSHDVLSVQVIDSSHATASVCVVDDSTLVEGPAGAVVAEGVTTAEWTVSLVLVDESWRVEMVDEGEPKEGAGRCD